MLNEAGLKAAATVEAQWDGRTFDAMGRADRDRYTERLRAAITAYLSTVEKPVAVREPGFDWTVSQETEQAMREIDDSIRAAHIQASTTFVGSPTPPASALKGGA